MFEQVYRVSSQPSGHPADDIDALASELGFPLAAGYREYLTELGDGELCDRLRVWAPDRIREEKNHFREDWVEFWDDGCLMSETLTRDDLLQAYVMAAFAGGDDFVGCPRFPGELFRIPRNDEEIRPVSGGIASLVEDSFRVMLHDFPFFETWQRVDERRRHQVIQVPCETGLEGFLREATARWGAAGLRRSRTAEDETFPNVFVRPLEARFILHLYQGPPSFSVVATYDQDAEEELADFMQALGA